MKKLINKLLKWQYKEEFAAAIVFIALFAMININFSKSNPEAGLFNLPSLIDTVAFSIAKFVITLALVWVGYRIIFPNIYKYIRNDVYNGFDSLPQPDKLNWALKVLMVLAFVAAVTMARAQTPELDKKRNDLETLVKSQVGIHEITENDSPEIRKFLAHVGIYKPAYWCVAWVSYDLSAVGVDNPRSAWSPDYAKPKDIIWAPKRKIKPPLAGDVITIYYSNLKRVGHGCFYLETDKSGYFITGEGNANQKLSRTGGEVCILKRDPNKVHAISRFIK